MPRTSFAVVPLVALVLASSGAAPASPQRTLHGAATQVGVVRRALLPKWIRYKLGSARYPKAYHPRCGVPLNVFAVSGHTATSVLTFAGGVPATIYVGPCHAAAGDSMTATLTDVYGHIVFLAHPSPGNFVIEDTGVDSQSTLTIRDHTTGHSATTSVWYAY